MGQAELTRPLALVVEDDENQRELLAMLFEESEMQVLECESAEAAMTMLHHYEGKIALLFTDVQLAGEMDGVHLAAVARELDSNMRIVVTSGRDRPRHLPVDVTFMPKPWRSLDVLVEAQEAISLPATSLPARSLHH